MSIERKTKIEVLEKTQKVTKETEDLVVEKEESVEQKELISTFQKFEEINFDGEIKKPYELIEGNMFYMIFRREGFPDPFVEFDDYIRKSIGSGIYKNAEFSKPNLSEIVPLLGRYKQIVDTLTSTVLFDREKLEVLDVWLAEFLEDRIKHFVKTLDLRIHDVSMSRAGGDEKAGAQIEAQLILKIPTEFLQEKQEEIELIQSGDDIHEIETDENLVEYRKYEFKAYRLAQISREITDRISEVLRDINHADPLIPDKYHE
jgi:hypothetical protein